MIDKVLQDWKNKKYVPIYWLEGEEVYYIDKLVQYAETTILTDDEKSFNQTILYGKDSDWAQVVNACRRYPMNSEKQLVIVKEAQYLKDIEKLEPYFDKPLASTILIIAYKDKKVDARTKFAKKIKDNHTLLSFKKLYENQLPEWANSMIQAKGYTIKSKALLLLTDHVGNDLNRLENEIDKLIINLTTTKEITDDHIEKYIGISKEYNVFELQSAIATKNMAKATQIIQYFENNPKSGPIHQLLPTLYSYFAKLFLLCTVMGNDDRTIAAAVGIAPFLLKEYKQAAKTYQYNGVEKAILLLQHYNLKSLGIDNSSATDAALMKEMVFKIIYS